MVSFSPKDASGLLPVAFSPLDRVSFVPCILSIKKEIQINEKALEIY
jgi:hypothetical protein